MAQYMHNALRVSPFSFFMKMTQSAFLPISLSLVLFTALAAQAADQTYVFTPTYGNPYDMSGTIVLNTPYSADGTAADIVSMTLSDNVSGTYDVDLATDIIGIGPLTWNPTEIVSMNISVENEGGTGPIYWPISASEVTDDTYNADYEYGTWQASAPPPVVPDTFSTFACLLISALGLWKLAPRKTASCLRQTAR